MKIHTIVTAGVFACLMLSAGCATQIHTVDGETISGNVVESDATRIYVERDDGEVESVERSAVTDVQLKSETTMITGGAIAGAGLVGLAVMVVVMESQPNDGLDLLAGVAIGMPSLAALGSGLVTALVGSIIWGAEERDMMSTETDSRVDIAPWVTPEPEGGVRGGIGVGVRF